MNLILGLFMPTLAQQTDIAFMHLSWSGHGARMKELFTVEKVVRARIFFLIDDPDLDICQLSLVHFLRRHDLDIILGVRTRAKRWWYGSGGSICYDK